MRHHRLITATSSALVVAALAAGPAAAQSQDLRSPDARDAAAGRLPTTAQVASQDLRSPDARDAAGRPAATTQVASQDLRSPDARDAADGRKPGPVPVIVRVPAESPQVDDGVDWDSVAIGALTAAGLLFALAGMFALVSHHRAPKPPSAIA